MAKPRPVPDLDPKGRLAPNVRRVLAVRIAEVYAYDGIVADPLRVRELHDLRIALKRLRYLLEVFDATFRDDLASHLADLRALQDLLGRIHDRDVQIPLLERHLDWLSAREAEAARALVTAGAGRAPARSEAAYRRFRARLAETRRADERPGIHALIAARRAERRELHDRFLDEWRRLKRERFRARLEAAVGVSRGRP